MPVEVKETPEGKTGHLLKIEGLKKHYVLSTNLMGKPVKSLKAVDEVTLTIREGETLGIVGESGCGKSTLGNMITRLIEPTGGKVVFENRDLLSMSEKEMRNVRKDIQMIFQDPFSSLNPRMRVFDIIAEPLRTHGVATGESLKKRVEELLEIVGLNRSQGKRFPHEFSGGQRQRIGIARAIALHPKLVVCDEPVSALDVSIQAQILNLLIKLQKELNLTYIFIGHGIPAVKYISDRIAVMYMGEIVEMASKENLFKATKHPYTQGLIDSVPIPDPLLRRDREELLIKGEVSGESDPGEGCRFYPRCPFGTEMCRIEKPSLREHAPDHFAACHYPLS
nr:oligopeptide/dipeptide ABC transporter ATP-binding protein [Edaphobacillus lindanitolerans]